MLNNINFLIITACLLFCLIFTSCDEITPPYEKKDTIVVDSSIAKIVIEDYTGFKCLNCPEATQIAHDLQEIYGNDQIYVVSIHAGTFAVPNQFGTTDKYKYDFRTQVGNELNEAMGVKGYPSGTINRITYDGVKPVDRKKWASKVSELINEKVAAPLKIVVAPVYDPQTRKISVEVGLKYIAAASNQNAISVWILEDNFINWQKDGDIDVEFYEHNNILRYSFNGTWGDVVSSNTITVNEEFIKKYSYILPEDSDWTPENLKVIAFVYDNAAAGRILQAEQKAVVIQ